LGSNFRQVLFMNSSDQQTHWDEIYGQKPASELTWFEQGPTLSLELILKYAAHSAEIIDIGAGTSQLVDELQARGFQNLSVLDLSKAAIEKSRARLGIKANAISWMVEDITRWQPQKTYDLWHDRAVFHFLTSAEDRDLYKKALAKALPKDGLAIIATFSLTGPEKCSGLAVMRYCPTRLAEELGTDFQLVESCEHHHQTPKGGNQDFQYSVFRKRG
jgi:SAM-dependent methyltransferase